jgi:peptidoglycan/LPS O-acetylase OafA/YrhL
MIEGWRALAALGVMFSHLGLNPGFDLGAACVLLFFVISGYCIAASAESCERNGLGMGGYMFRRFKRIYPPYFFALLLFIGTRVIKAAGGGEQQLPANWAVWLQNFTLTQWLSLLAHPKAQAFSNPSLFVAGFWSLNYEEQFYLVMGLIVFGAIALKRSPLLPVLVLMAAGIVWNIVFPRISFGMFIEYWICFAVGCLVYFRLCKLSDLRLRIAIEISIWLIFACGLWFDATSVGSGRSGPGDWVVASGFALVLIYSRPLDDVYTKSLAGIALGWLSLGSYSLYLTHQMNLTSSSAFSALLIGHGLPRQAEVALRALFMCGFAAVFWFCCERPFVNRQAKRVDGLRSDLPSRISTWLRTHLKFLGRAWRAPFGPRKV